MRERVNHRNIGKKAIVDNNFWKEFRKRGFNVDPKNDGCFVPEVKEAGFRKKSSTTYEVKVSKNYKFNVVPPKTFMKTVAQIEGLVKYKLFK